MRGRRRIIDGGAGPGEDAGPAEVDEELDGRAATGGTPARIKNVAI
jgi:hypothetical protein